MYVKGNSAERAGGGLFLSDNAVANVTHTTFEENLARAGFKLSSGGCEVSGGCFFTPGYPLNYGNYERCEIPVNSDTILDVISFHTKHPE